MLVYQETLNRTSKGSQNITNKSFKNVLVGVFFAGAVITILYLYKKNKNEK